MTIRSVLAALIILALAFAACGGDDNETPTDGANTPAATEGTATMSDQEGPPPVSAEPTVTASGLQIIDVEVGTGAEAVAGATVTVHYTGWLEDGTVFDSSVERGQPVTFPLTGLIQGWQEGIPGMKVGGTRRLIIPPELAYGENGSPPTIPGNAVLTFDIELLDVQ